MTFQAHGRHYPTSHHVLPAVQPSHFRQDLSTTPEMKKTRMASYDGTAALLSDNRIHGQSSKIAHAPCHGNMLPLHTDPEMYALRNMFPSHALPTWSEPKSLPNHRLAYVEALVDTNAHVIETIWSSGTTQYNKSAVVPLRTFIQEVLKRSRTTYSTLQTALFYLFRAQPTILDQLYGQNTDVQNGNHCWREAYISCGRRMFLASLVVASKFVQDKTYRNSAWAKIAGLPVAEINAAERIFLDLIDYRLYISQATFQQWHHLLHMHVEARAHNQPGLFLHDLSMLTSADSAHSSTAVTRQPTSHSPSETCPRKRRLRDSQLADDRLSTAYLVVSPSPSCSPGSLTSSGDSTSPNASQISSNGSNGIPPALSLSLPSSRSSTPLHTPTEVSPVRANHGALAFTWKTGSSPAPHTSSLDANPVKHRVFAVSDHSHLSGDMYSPKRRRVALDDAHCNHGFAISHVRSMRRKQQRVVP